MEGEKEKRGIVDNILVKKSPPPHNINIEQAILGAMLLDQDARSVAIEKIKDPSFFYIPAHQKIFSVISKLYTEHNDKIDTLSVAILLNSEGALDAIGGEKYILDLQDSITTTAHIESWCDTLNDLAALRKIIKICGDTISRCYENDMENISTIFADLEKSIFDAQENNVPTTTVHISNHIKDVIKYLENLYDKKLDATGISTGLPSIDKLIIGLKKQEMVVIAARPSIGKTSLALNMASHIAINKKMKVGFFSLEMSSEQLTRRLICSIAKVPERDFYDGRWEEEVFNKKWSQITKAASELKKAEFYIDPTPGLSINELRAKSLRMFRRYNIDIIFIDYLQLMRADITRNDNRQVEVSRISVGIKSLAKELNIPIVVLAQLNRQAEHQDRPKLSHLRESGAIEQDADIVMFLHRDKDPQKDPSLDSIDAEIIVEKNRNGQTGIAELIFFPKIMRFESKSKYPEEF